MKKRKSTTTSNFGVSKREGHDSSRFYNCRLYDGQRNHMTKRNDFIDNTIPKDTINTIYCKTSEKMDELPKNSINLMVTSPPYNASKEYDKNLSLVEYLDLLRKVFKETYDKLVIGGRACINIANLGRKPYIPLNSYIAQIMLSIGYLMRGEVIWNKASSSGTSTAWGSWKSAVNPTLRDVHEYIMIFSKDDFSRPKIKERNTITKEEFLEYTKSIWSFPSESAQKIKHPAPFPIELPYRCIQLYTFKDDIILDPFMGSGSTALAAIKSERYFVGYDINEVYIKIAERRMKNFLKFESS